MLACRAPLSLMNEQTNWQVKKSKRERPRMRSTARQHRQCHNIMCVLNQAWMQLKLSKYTLTFGPATVCKQAQQYFAVRSTHLGATRHVSDAKQPKTCRWLSLTTSREALLRAACRYRVFKLMPSLQATHSSIMLFKHASGSCRAKARILVSVQAHSNAHGIYCQQSTCPGGKAARTASNSTFWTQAKKLGGAHLELLYSSCQSRHLCRKGTAAASAIRSTSRSMLDCSLHFGQ